MIFDLNEESTINPLVSVVMPVFNGAEFLMEAVKSVLNQGFSDLELIIVNDGSTDNTKELISSIQDQRVVILNLPENVGISSALNFGFAVARGQFIARMDSDDICVSDRLSLQIDFMKRNPKVSLSGGSIRLFPGPPITSTRPLDDANIRSFLPFGSPFCHPTVIFRREHFQKSELKYLSEWDAAEDYELWLRLANTPGIVFANQQETLLHYRVHKISKSDYYAAQESLAFSISLLALRQNGVMLEDPQKRVWQQLLHPESRTEFSNEYMVEKLVEIRLSIQRAEQKLLLRHFDKQMLKLLRSLNMESHQLIRFIFRKGQEMAIIWNYFFLVTFVTRLRQKLIRLMKLKLKIFRD